MEICAVLSWEVLPLVNESLASSPTLLLNNGPWIQRQLLIIEGNCSLHPRESLQNYLPGVSKPCQHDLRKTLLHWNSDSLHGVIGSRSLLFDLGAATLKITLGFVRLCQSGAGGRLPRGGGSRELLLPVCLLRVDFLFLLVPPQQWWFLPLVVAAPTLQFLQLLRTSSVMPPQSHQHQASILPSSEVWGPMTSPLSSLSLNNSSLFLCSSRPRGGSCSLQLLPLW